MRTYLFDSIIREQVAQGADMVVNFAAGLDTRPYRESATSRRSIPRSTQR
jgi:O-methyltransferase involved in polyketide biosynthesis